jgi:hypothetical protein
MTRRFPHPVAGILRICAVVLVGTLAIAQDMPDPSLMHGKPLPAGDLPSGTVTVRVMREAIGNNVAGQAVRLAVDGAVRTATTDTEGRAQFDGLSVGAQVRAEAVVDGEMLTSDTFAVPATGGLRVALVAGIARAAERRAQQSAAALAEPPVRGVIVLGGETRVLGEFQSDVLRMFYTLDIVNSARTRVDIGGPFIFDLPESAVGATLLEGAPKAATINGRRLTVQGPFNPGTTRVQIGFEVQYSGSEHTLNQVFPIAVQQWIVGVERVGTLALSSPQFQRTQDQATDDGTVFAVGSGQPLTAGSVLTLQLRNLPAQGRVAGYVALTIALGVVLLGAWLSISADSTTPGIRAGLLKRREALLAKLADVERARQSGSLSDEKYLARRERLLRDLEQVYGELESLDAPSGGDAGVAA